MRRYVVSVFALLIAMVAGGAGLLSVKYWLLHDVEYSDLLKYQLDKIEHATQIDTIFIGDSTLGNSVDARAFDALTGRRSLNLALTGLYGYAGSFNMLRRAVEQHPVRLVVVVQTLDMMQRPVSYDGFLFTARIGYLSDVPPQHWLPLAVALFTRLTDYSQLPRLIGSLLRGSQAIPLDPLTDYVAQESPLPRAHFPPHGFSPDSVNPAKGAFLESTANYCRAKSLVCVYMHGPLWRPLIEKSSGYIDRVNGIIEEAGLPMAYPVPLDIDESQVGDGVNHVHPKDKVAFTTRYIGALAPYLSKAHAADWSRD